VIDHALLARLHLNQRDYAALHALLSFAPGATCQFTINRIRDATGFPASCVRRALARLVAQGLITLPHGLPDAYDVNVEFPMAFSREIRQAEGPVVMLVPDARRAGAARYQNVERVDRNTFRADRARSRLARLGKLTPEEITEIKETNARRIEASRTASRSTRIAAVVIARRGSAVRRVGRVPGTEVPGG
jgi:hypothetical protein